MEIQTVQIDLQKKSRLKDRKDMHEGLIQGLLLHLK